MPTAAGTPWNGHPRAVRSKTLYAKDAGHFVLVVGHYGLGIHINTTITKGNTTDRRVAPQKNLLRWLRDVEAKHDQNSGQQQTVQTSLTAGHLDPLLHTG